MQHEDRLFSTGRNEESISELFFDFGYARLDTFADGSGRVLLKAAGQTPDIEVLTPGVKSIGFLGAKHQPTYIGLGYPMQDPVTRRYANLEHIALHLWISQAKNDFYLARPLADKYHVRAVLQGLNDITGGKVDERALEESFATNVQLISNGIQLDEMLRGELETACTFLGLNNTTAITAALAFVQFFRSAMRKTYAPCAV